MSIKSFLCSNSGLCGFGVMLSSVNNGSISFLLWLSVLISLSFWHEFSKGEQEDSRLTVARYRFFGSCLITSVRTLLPPSGFLVSPFFFVAL